MAAKASVILRQKEMDHGFAGVGSRRVGVRTEVTATSPCVPCTMHKPLLHERPASPVAVDGSGVASAATGTTGVFGGLQRHPAFLTSVCLSQCLRNDMSTVSGVDRLVAVTVKDDGRNEKHRCGSRSEQGVLRIGFHRCEC